MMSRPMEAPFRTGDAVETRGEWLDPLIRPEGWIRCTVLRVSRSWLMPSGWALSVRPLAALPAGLAEEFGAGEWICAGSFRRA